MNDAPKILINGRVLAQLLANSAPEVEIDLVKSATAQVAEQFKRKINPDQIIERMLTLLPNYLSITPQAKEIITKQAQHIIDAILSQTIRDDIKIAVNKIIDNQASMMRREFTEAVSKVELTKIVDAMVEKKVKDTIDAYRRI
jgi:DNA polymerase III gamma/tau subunit